MDQALAQLIEDNLKKVWSERDPAIRAQMIERLYQPGAALNHVGHTVSGHVSINDSVSTVLAEMPKEFVFFQLKPVVINNDIGRLLWAMGPDERTPIVTGMDIAIFEGGKIKSLYVFIDR